MSETTRNPTDEERRYAEVQSTVWGGVWEVMRDLQDDHLEQKRIGIDANLVTALSLLAMTVSGEYRRIGNGADIDL